VLRLVGASGETDGWAVRVRAVVAGASRLVRSREAWDRYRATAREGVRRMADAVTTEPVMTEPVGTNGHARVGDEGLAPARAVEAPLVRWRRATEEAIAEAEREADRLLARAVRDRRRAGELTQQVKLLRRALSVVAGAAGAEAGPLTSGSTLRSRLLDWARAHGDELVASACTEALGLTSKRVSDAAGHLREEGLLERVGKGHYRLLREPAEAAG
jgi:hypothetical protein